MNILFAAATTFAFAPWPAADPPTLRLPASPSTVAGGTIRRGPSLWALPFHSGDTFRIQPLDLRSQRALDEGRGGRFRHFLLITAYLSKVTDKGPGGHILTGPVAIAERTGRLLEVQISED